MLKLQAFGEPAIHDGQDSHPLPFVKQTKRFALFIYLACTEEGTPRSRDELSALFWPESDSERASNALRQALFVIRRELGPDILLGVGSPFLAVNRALLQSDVELFHKALRDEESETALGLYEGDFLAGFHISDAPEFCFWAEEERARLRDFAYRSAEGLARRSEARRDRPSALFWWRRALQLNPFDEPTLCRVMSLLAMSGNRSAALAEFRRFRRRAEIELGVEPSPITLQLAARAARGDLGRNQFWVGDRRRETEGPPGRSSFRRSGDTSPFG